MFAPLTSDKVGGSGTVLVVNRLTYILVGFPALLDPLNQAIALFRVQLRQQFHALSLPQHKSSRISSAV